MMTVATGSIITLSSTLPRFIVADRRHLEAILRNVLGNAWKYRAPERELQVLIRLEQAGDTSVLSIADNGIGFDHDPNVDVTAPFYA